MNMGQGQFSHKTSEDAVGADVAEEAMDLGGMAMG